MTYQQELPKTSHLSRNLPVSWSPTSWDKVYGHETQKQILQSYLRNNNHPNVIYISGPSGTGKGTLLKVYLMALHCHNRPPGGIDPCGYCPSCKQDPRAKGEAGNVIWVQAGKGDEGGKQTITQQMNAALASSWNPPVGAAALPDHRRWKTIVVDELQAVDRTNLQNILFPSELELLDKNRVIWILVTMDSQRIAQKDAELHTALTDRAGGKLYLRKFSKAKIKDFLLNHLKLTLPLESAELLADYSDGRIRKVLSALQTLYSTFDGVLSPQLISQVLNYPSPLIRQKFWAALRVGVYGESYQVLKEIYRQIIENFSEIDFIHLLLEDLDLAAASLSGSGPQVKEIANNILFAQTKLLKFVSGDLPLTNTMTGWTVVSTLRGKPLVATNQVSGYGNNGLELLTANIESLVNPNESS